MGLNHSSACTGLTVTDDGSADNFSILFNISRDGIAFIDRDGRITEANAAFAGMLGYDADEIKTIHIRDFSPDRWAGIIDLPARGGDNTPAEAEKTYKRKNGSVFPVKERTWRIGKSQGQDARTLLVVRDDSLQKNLEIQLRQAQKMEAVGTLAGGIAHDFNNILTAVMGYVELARFDIRDDSPARERLERIRKASHRAKDLIRHILDFSRQSETRSRIVNIKPIIKETLQLLRATLPSTIRLQKDITVKPSHVRADPTQIHQVLMNLCTNAFHAMADTGGTLTISLIPVRMDAREAAAHLNLKPGRFLALTVRDTGCGMDAVTLGRIFDPYFTTKEKGQGTGMGLAVVHGIVTQNGGSITVESRPGKGSTFRLLLPRVKPHAGSGTGASGQRLCGNERILLVDDEADIADAARQMLERFGYSVTAATDSAEAFALFQKAPGTFDILVTDTTMPDMTGDRLAQKVRAIVPDLPVIRLSGSSPPNAGPDHSRDRDYLLAKPFEVRELARLIRQALDSVNGSWAAGRQKNRRPGST